MFCDSFLNVPRASPLILYGSRITNTAALSRSTLLPRTTHIERGLGLKAATVPPNRKNPGASRRRGSDARGGHDVTKRARASTAPSAAGHPKSNSMCSMSASQRDRDQAQRTKSTPASAFLCGCFSRGLTPLPGFQTLGYVPTTPTCCQARPTRDTATQTAAE